MSGFTRRATLGLVALMLMALAGAGMAAEPVPYTPQVLADAKAGGKPFLLDFFADWCSTCKAQERVIGELAAANPAYAGVPVIQVDWDQEGRGELVRQMSIPRRSTLVVLRGDAELGRVVAATGKDDIARLLDLAL